MRDYGKVYTRFWESDDIRTLSEDGRVLALYLMTCKHGTIAGVFRLPDGYAGDDLQWSTERVGQGFEELSAKGFAQRCPTSKWVWIRKHLEWNRAENPNQRKAVAKWVATIPLACTWRQDFLQSVDDLLGPETEGSETVSEPLPNQKQKQKQEQQQQQHYEKASPRGSRLPDDWVLPDDWRLWAERERPDLDASLEAAKFTDYWHGKAGKDGRKADWEATWRNWVRRADAPRSPHRIASSDVFAGAQ